MRFIAVAIAALVAGCGYQIGASCVVDTDCSADGSRFCDQTQPGGYCTIMGCDYNTCPSDGECVKFYLGSFANEPCDYTTEDTGSGSDACSYDEECSVANECVPRSAEVRYCMSNCDNNGDCRSGYECRHYNTMKGSNGGYLPGSMQLDGGEVVLAPGNKDDSGTKGFCAPTETGN